MDLTYPAFDLYLEVYVEKVNDGDENELSRFRLRKFFDAAKFAGESNMGHFLTETGYQKKTC